MTWFMKLIPIFLLFSGASFLVGLARSFLNEALFSSDAADVQLVEVVNPDSSYRR